MYSPVETPAPIGGAARSLGREWPQEQLPGFLTVLQTREHGSRSTVSCRSEKSESILGKKVKKVVSPFLMWQGIGRSIHSRAWTANVGLAGSAAWLEHPQEPHSPVAIVHSCQPTTLC